VLVGARDPVALHAAAARALARAGAAAGRIANHLEQAGDLEGAAVALVAELERRVDATEVVAAERVAAQAEQLLDAVRAPAGDSRRVRVLLQRARAADLAGRCHEGIALAQTAVDLLGTAASTMPSLAVEARIALATCLRGAGRYADAESTLRVALEHAGEGTTLRARALLSLARVDLLSGALPRAERHLNDALGTFETAAATDADALPYAAECVGRIGDVARQRGDFVAAARRFEDAAARYRAIGHVSGESTQLHGLAEAHRLLGRLAEAEDGYHRTIAMDASVGKDTSIPRFNLSLCLLARGSAEAAEATLLGLEDEWRRAGRADMVAYALAGRVCTAAMRGDRAEGGGRLAAYLAAADAGGVDIDLAQLMERSATAWRAHGESDHADACAEVALAQWRALGDTEAVSRVEASLSRRARDG
jgi:tetratricopeptide (TPR) repeat protein